MEPLYIIINVVLAGLAIWWIRRTWYRNPELSERLESAAKKAFAGMLLAFWLPVFLLKNDGLTNSYMIAVVGWIFCAGGLFLAAAIARAVEVAAQRRQMRLSGRPVPPKLWSPWRVAGIVAAMSLIGFLVVLQWLGERYTLMGRLSQNAQSAEDGMKYFTEFVQASGLAALGFLVIVLGTFTIQAARISISNRHFEELSAGIEKRLSEQASS